MGLPGFYRNNKLKKFNWKDFKGTKIVPWDLFDWNHTCRCSILRLFNTDGNFCILRLSRLRWKEQNEMLSNHFFSSRSPRFVTLTDENILDILMKYVFEIWELIILMGMSGVFRQLWLGGKVQIQFVSFEIFFVTPKHVFCDLDWRRRLLGTL